SHPPVLPQVDVASVGHSSSGSVEAAIGPQVPSEPEPFFAAEQAWQVPVQAVAQHTPSTQPPPLVGSHSRLVEQDAPGAMYWQVVPLQFSVAQSPATAHVRPTAQGGQDPPQSTSVSSPSLT